MSYGKGTLRLFLRVARTNPDKDDIWFTARFPGMNPIEIRKLRRTIRNEAQRNGGRSP